MNKSLIFLGLLLLSAFGSWAQLAEGGLPVSLRQGIKDELNKPKVINLQNPDWAAYLAKEQEDQKKGISKPFMVALFAEADVRFPNSGSFTPVAAGGQIWSAEIHIAAAPAIGLYFNQFHLPEGVEMYLMNSNKKQILGAYTAQNNRETQTFAIEPVQGERVNIELFIPDGISIQDLQLSIDKAAVYHRAIENLSAFIADSLQPIDAIDNQLNGGSSVCMINSTCPQGDGFEDQRKATLQVLSIIGAQGVGACTGTLVNTTTNNEEDCKKYVLYASHCDGGSGTAASQFSQSIFRFNFEHASCESNDAPESNTITGAEFVTRSICPEDIEQIDGDFLMVSLSDNIPESWDVKIAGWNRNPSLSTSTVPPAKFIGFHHPDGDNKKLTTYQAIQSEGLGAPGSHWASMAEEGYVSTGSSGSGLFTNSGHLIGIASVAGEYDTPPANCQLNANGDTVYAMNFIAYSKFSRNWDYTKDGNEDSKKLKPWLDPNNSGVMEIGSTNSSCTEQSSAIHTVNGSLDNAISIFPNPVTNNTVNIQFNLQDQGDLNLELLDVNGRSLNKYHLNHVKQGQYSIQTADLANGMYLLKIKNRGATATKKVMINR